MAGQKQHDYHIVNPSVWPFFTAVATFIMLVGAIFWLNADMPWLFWAGLVGVVYAAVNWWADIIKEGAQGDHTPVVKIGLRYGMALFIMSEVMFFVAWFWMYFKHAIFPMQSAEFYPDGGVWPPQGVELIDPWGLPLLNTLILLSSGATATWAHHAIMENDNKTFVRALFYTIVLGVVFTGVQAYEYYEIIHLSLFGESGNIFQSAFFAATGFHGLHVIIGTIFLIVCLVIGMRGGFDSENHVAFESAAWYWHFVDVVWLFLFAGIYVGAVWGL